jgi:hypothetical protein
MNNFQEWLQSLEKKSFEKGSIIFPLHIYQSKQINHGDRISAAPIEMDFYNSDSVFLSNLNKPISKIIKPNVPEK